MQAKSEIRVIFQKKNNASYSLSYQKIFKNHEYHYTYMTTVEETETMPRTKEEIEADNIMKNFRKNAQDINRILMRKTIFQTRKAGKKKNFLLRHKLTKFPLEKAKAYTHPIS